MITSHLKTLNPPAVDTAAAPMIAVTSAANSGGASPIMNPFVVTSDAALKNCGMMRSTSPAPAVTQKRSAAHKTMSKNAPVSTSRRRSF